MVFELALKNKWRLVRKKRKEVENSLGKTHTQESDIEKGHVF